MLNITDFINEDSRNAKHRNVKFIKDMFFKGKKMGNIGSFGILTSENPNSGADYDNIVGKGKDDEEKEKDRNRQITAKNKKLYDKFANDLKHAHIKYTLGEGKFGNLEDSFVVFNIKLDELKYYAGKYEQTSFWYCYPEDGKLMCEYWQKTDTSAKYNKTKNPYELIETSSKWEEIPGATDYYTAIGKNFKFSINLKYFEKTNESIENGLSILAERLQISDTDYLLDFATNRAGQTAWYYRNLINS